MIENVIIRRIMLSVTISNGVSVDFIPLVVLGFRVPGMSHRYLRLIVFHSIARPVARRVHSAILANYSTIYKYICIYIYILLLAILLLTILLTTFNYSSTKLNRID